MRQRFKNTKQDKLRHFLIKKNEHNGQNKTIRKN